MTTQLPSDQTFQNVSYSFMPSYLRPARLGQDSAMMLDSAPPTSVIFFPVEGRQVRAGDIIVKGYAVADISREIERVELSLDAGRTWIETELCGNPQPGEWRLWRKWVSLEPGQYELVARAADSLLNKGPSDVDLTWHRVRFKVVP